MWKDIFIFIVVAAAIFIVWRAARKKSMNRIPVGVGDGDAQVRFLEHYKPFLTEYPGINNVLEKAFLRAMKQPSEAEFKAILELPDDDPRFIAFEDKLNADLMVFYLGRICVDDFGEIINLAGNGRGLGAYKILRGMYERVVTAAYVAKHPAESRAFMEEESIQRWKLWNSALKFSPELKEQVPEEKQRGLEEAYGKARAKKKESICKTCNQPKTAEAWTRVDLASMAEKADVNLAVLYGSCYQEPTFHSHATSFGMSSRIRRNEQNSGWTFREITEREARTALQLAHNLILRVLGLQEEHFKLGLEAEIQPRFKAFPAHWDPKLRIPRGQVVAAASIVSPKY